MGRYLGVYSLDLPGSRDSFATRGLIDDTISGFRILSVEKKYEPDKISKILAPGLITMWKTCAELFVHQKIIFLLKNQTSIFLSEISKATRTILLKIIFPLQLFVFYTLLKFVVDSFSAYFLISPFVLPKFPFFLSRLMNFSSKIDSSKTFWSVTTILFIPNWSYRLGRN